jgi:hypothetical protein
MLHRLLLPNRKEAPRKKIRGLKRYFRRVFRGAESFCQDVNLDESSYFAYHHYHPDRFGYGNLNWRMRARHLEAIAFVFATLAQQLNQFDKPHQVWIYLDADAQYDAVYVHSPNPNGDNFPLTLDDAEWGVPEVSGYFEALLPGYHLRAGRWSNSDSYYIYSPDLGVPLERAQPRVERPPSTAI